MSYKIYGNLRRTTRLVLNHDSIQIKKRNMSSWANLRSAPLKKKEPSIRFSFTPLSSDYATSTLSFLYSFVFTQRTAEPFYIYDTQGYFQPLLKTSPILHYLKESPKESLNLYEETSQVSPIIQNTSFAALKRTVNSVYQFNPETDSKIKAFLTTAGLNQEIFDVGIVLDTSGCIAPVLSQLTNLQKRTGKKTLKVFVMTDNIGLLQEFATKGNPSWSFKSLLRNGQPNTLIKMLAELRVLRNTEYVAVRFATDLGKLIYLTHSTMTMESQILSLDGATWKPVG